MTIYDNTDRIGDSDWVYEQPVRRVFPDGTDECISRMLISEHRMDILLNCEKIMSVVCSKEHLPYLVVGRLISDGILENSDEILFVSICETGREARVITTGEKKLSTALPNQVSCCTQNVNYVENMESKLSPLAKVTVSEKEIFEVINAFTNDQKVHKLTGGTHSSYLFYEGKLMFACEDIGRHNALDKAIGYLYANELAPEKAILFTTGRVPVDMIEKVIRGRIPVLISKAVPTVEAAELASKYGVKLYCRAWPDSYEVYDCRNT